MERSRRERTRGRAGRLLLPPGVGGQRRHPQDAPAPVAVTSPRTRRPPARLTDGPITPALVRLAWPVFVSRALHTFYTMADTAWVGRIGAEAIAAVSTSFFASWILFAVGDVLIAGVTALVSQSVGAERDDEAARSAITGIVLAVGMGACVATVGWFGSPVLFRLLLDDPEIVRLGADYLSILCLVAPVFYLTFVAESIFRSCGDSRTPMNVILVGTVLNVVLDPFLIFGWGPFPRLEVKGAAIATMISETTVLLVYAVLWARRSFPLSLRLSRPRTDFSRRRAGQIVRIGTPPALVGVLFSVVYLFLARITGAFGAAALAALGIVNRLESVNYMTSIAVGGGVATMVGQNLGARKPERAESSADQGVGLISISNAVITIAFLVIPEPISRIFTSDPSAIAESVAFLRIVAISQVFMGAELVYGQAFTGAGDTMPPMYTSVLTSIVRIPLAWWLAFPAGLGPAGIWWTISATGILRGLILVVWFRFGRWKEKDLGIGEPLPAAVTAGPDSADG